MKTGIAAAAGFAACLLAAAACGTNEHSTSGQAPTSRSDTSTPRSTPTAPQLFNADAVDKHLIQPGDLGSGWGQFDPKDYPVGPASKFSWRCRPSDTAIPQIPAGGSTWQNSIATRTVPGLPGTDAILILDQAVAVYPTADQAAAAMTTLSAATANCGDQTIVRKQVPVPGQANQFVPGGDDSWRVASDDEAGWSGWKNTMLETYDNRDDRLNDTLLSLRRDNVILSLNINTSTPGPYPGFGKQEQSLVDRVLASLNTVAPAGSPTPSPSPPAHGLPRISADQLCAALSVQKLNSITGLSVKKADARTYAGGDIIECIYDTYTFDIQVKYGESPKEIQDLNSRVATRPIQGLGDAAGWLQGSADVAVRIGADSLDVGLPAMTPGNPFAPKDMTPPPLTMDAANQDALTIAKLLLSTQY